MDRKTVVVGMSGGVDSAVAAALLVEQGYNVIGITIKTYNYEAVGGNIGNESSCCSLDGINDARNVAAQLGFPHYVLDFSKQFEREVITNFVDEYLSGRTPNPCVICNRKIKWEELLCKADGLGAEFVATGHYAKVRYDEATGRYILSRGVDRMKDQSYALWRLTQESLSRTIFPLAELTKPQVRDIAERLGLKIANKSESFEICFIPDNDHGRFLKERVAHLSEKVSGGDIVMDGKIIGKHEGFPFYTIGQRRGLGVAVGEPIYVTKIDARTNTIQVGTEEKLMHKELVARDVNFIKILDAGFRMSVVAKIRYKDEGSPATIELMDSNTVKVMFDKPKRAITPGQSVVFYDGDDVVGGGIIDRVLEQM